MKRLALLSCLLLPLAALALEINDASRADLEQLNGVGVTLADKMLKERERAPFAGWDDLRARVKGLSGKRVQKWQGQGVTVNGERGLFTAVTPSKVKEAK
jgi:competence protein ComEA